MITTIATLATGVVIDDLRILLSTLQLFNEAPPTVYIFADTVIAAAIPGLAYPGTIVVKEQLNPYSGLTRADMEKLPGKRGNLFFDFTLEKIELLKWVLRQTSDALFCDADICFTAPLPIIPADKTVGLSPHMIRLSDEAKYGKYNAGFMWFSSLEAVSLWEKACSTSRFFEQAALEDVAAAFPDSLHLFPVTQNYGWWRLWQGPENPHSLLAKWAFTPIPLTSGLTIDGVPLGSIHTHFAEQKDMATREFNEIIRTMLKNVLKTVKYHSPAQQLLFVLAPK